SSCPVSCPSLAVRRRTYDPAAEKLAVVLSVAALPKVTVPGPLTLLQVKVSAAGGLGSPSSEAVPARLAVFGRVIVWSIPAFTVGARLLAHLMAASKRALPFALKLAAVVSPRNRPRRRAGAVRPTMPVPLS